MKRNHFLAALESQVPDTVDVSQVTDQSTLQPKPGVGEGQAEPSDDKVTKEFGEEHPFAEHDEIDTVAESQEHTLALEHLHHAVARFSRYANALEELAEQVEDRLAEDKPLQVEETALLTTALDASGVGEPITEQVALESFDFDARVATESFVETLKDRAKKVVEAITTFARRMADELKVRLNSLGTVLSKLPENRLKKLKKNIGEVAGFAGRNFDDAKREKSIQSRIFASGSSKTPLAALKDALAAYEAAGSFIDSRMTSAVAQATRAFSVDDESKLAASFNKVLDTAKELAKTHSEQSPFTTIKVSVDVPTLTAENASKMSYEKLKRTPVKAGGFDNSLKIASEADLKEIEAVAVKAGRVLQAKMMDVLAFMVNVSNFKSVLNAVIFDTRHGFRAASTKEQKGAGRGVLAGSWSAIKLNAAYRYSMYTTAYVVSSIELGLAEAVYRNANAACAWVEASIAEAKDQRKAKAA